MKDKILNNNQAQLPSPCKCQIRDSSDLYYKQEFTDSYKIGIEINLTADDDVDAHVYSLLDDIKALIHNRQNISSQNYEPIKNIEITRSQNMIIVNTWKEGISGHYLDYLNTPQLRENGRRGQVMETMEGNTREREGEVSVERNEN